MEALAYALEYPGAVIYLFRETYDDLEANIVKEWLEKVPPELFKYNETKHIASVVGGSTVYFRYIESKKDARKYNGRSIDWIGVDELTRHEEESIQILLSCLRSPKGFPPRFRGTCNPEGIGFSWVKERYILATNYGEKTIIDPVTGNRIVFIPAKVYDNPVLMLNDPAYARRLENLPSDLRKAYLEGDWDVFVGQYFTEYRRELHVIQPFELPSTWRRFRSIDWGFNDPSAVYWHCIGPDRHIYTYRELYANQLIGSELAAQIIDLTGNEEIDYTVASPDLWAKRGGEHMHGESIAETIANSGVPLRRADNARIIGWQRMREFLSIASDDKPWWQIFSTCNNLVRTLPAAIHDDHKVEDIHSKCEDHALESCRYFLLSRPSPNPDNTLHFPKNTSESEKAAIKKNIEFEEQYAKLLEIDKKNNQQLRRLSGW